MKYKGQIVGFLILCVVFGVLFAFWQFHFKEIFDGYKEEERLRASLEETMNQLQENFQGYKPELLIDAWQNEVQPWKNAREERGLYFNFGDWYQIDAVPPEARMLKFWYTEESNRQINDLYAKVYERLRNYNLVPQNIRMQLNVASEEDWAGRNISWDEVERNLRQLNFGVKLVTTLLEANVSSIREIVVWPRRFPEKFGGMLGLQTLGLHITMPAKDMVKMLEKWDQEPRYFSVDSLKVNNPYIAYGAEPHLDIQLLLTQANYRQPPDMKEPVAPPSAAADKPGETSTKARSRGADAAPQGALSSFWRWFKRVVLYMP